MADTSFEAQQLAEAMRQVQAELQAFGRVTKQSADELRDAEAKSKYGINNFTKGTETALGALTNLGSAGMKAGKAMLDGEKGAKAFNGSMDSMASAAQAAGAALMLLIPGGIIVKGLIAGLTAVTTATIKYAQAANEMADKQYKAFQGLAKSGAAASDGMTGIYKDAKKLGLSMNELDSYVGLIAESSQDLANFGGSVAKGRKQFADMGAALEPARESLLKMGMMPEQINEGMMGYLRTQTRLGQAQGKTTADLAEGARKYLVEQDALTKLTGVSRQEIEKQREAALMEEQFAAKVRELQLNGQTEAAARLIKLNDAATALSPALGKMVRAASTGNLVSEDAQKLMMSSPDAFKSIQEVIAGSKTAAQGLDVIGKQVGQTADKMGTNLALIGANDKNFIAYGEAQKIRVASEKGIAATLTQIEADQKAQGVTGGKAADAILDNQAKLINAQILANKATEAFIEQGIGSAQKEMIKLANATTLAANALNKMAGAGDGSKVNATTTQKTQLSSVGATYQATDNERKSMMEALNDPSVSKRDKEWIQQQLKNLPARAAGGPVTAGQSYLIGEKGPELFVPEMSGNIVPNGMMNTGADQGDRADKMDSYGKALLKDTESLTKITATDLKRTKNFSILQNKLFDRKIALMTDELELLDEQNSARELQINEQTEVSKRLIALNNFASAVSPALGKMVRAASKGNMSGGLVTSGSGAPVTSGSGAPVMSGAPAPAPAGGGLKMPSAPPIASMGGGQGLQATKQEDLKKMGLNIKAGDVQAEGAGISPKLLEMAKAIQSGVPGFNYFSAFNDKFHNEKAPSSQHTKGLAMDFTLVQPPSVDDGKQITEWLRSMGASLAIDEYNNPSSKATAGHIHAQIPAFANGGLVDSPTLSLIGEAGPEAVVPLAGGSIPVEIKGGGGLGGEAMSVFKAMADQSAAMASMLQELLQAQKDSNSTQQKMLRMQS